MRKTLSILFAFFTCSTGFSDTFTLPTEWNPDWTLAGWRGDIPATNDPGWTIYAVLGPSSSHADINAAIAAAPANSIIILSNTPGQQFVLTNNIRILRSNIELRGMGAWMKQIRYTNGTVNPHGLIEVFGSSFSIPPTFNRNWTAGYARGANSLTFNSAASLSVGDQIILTQISDKIHLVSAMGNEGGCDYCAGCINDVNYTQQEHVWVTSVAGTTVGIDPPIMGTNFASGYSPKAYYFNTTITNVIIRDLGIDNVAGRGTYNIEVMNAAQVAVVGCWSDVGNEAHFKTLHCSNIEVRDSLFTRTLTYATQSYGIAPYNVSRMLVENCIFNSITGPWKGTSCSGSVFAYNYITNVYYSSSLNWLIGSVSAHGSHCYLNLFEGNIMPSIYMDDIHGSSSHNVFLRNRSFGVESNRVANTFAFALESTNLWYTAIGNLFGKAGYHTVRRAEYPATVTTDATIYLMGYANTFHQNFGGDPNVATTLLETHNWDSYTWSTVGTNNGVVYADGYGASTTIPDSFYLSVKPSWWGCSNWPSIGPDLLSICTNDAAVFNPARYRWETGNYFTNLIDFCGHQDRRDIRGLKLKK